MDLNNFRVLKAPATAFYVPNFITEKEEKYLYDEVYKSPRTKWTTLSNRRLQNWGGIPNIKGMIQEPLPKWLHNCCSKVAETKAFDACFPNHVLVNEYKPGQGIMPHEDGPLYYPTVSTISLGSHTVLNVYELRTGDNNPQAMQSKFGFLLERRSLLILQDSMYTSHMHGIDETVVDELHKDFIWNVDKLGDKTLVSELDKGMVSIKRDTRVSLTIRHVPKTIKLKLQIGKSFG